MREATKEEIIKSDLCLTVGDLKKFISENNLDDSAKVLIQRIEDVYFDKMNWSVYLKEGDFVCKDKDDNEDKSTYNQYHTAFSCIKYNEDAEFLFIDSHY